MLGSIFGALTNFHKQSSAAGRRDVGLLGHDQHKSIHERVFVTENAVV